MHRLRRRWRFALAVIAAALTPLPSVVAAAGAGPPLAMEGCPQVYVQLPLPAERIRPLVPRSYRLLGEGTGTAQLQVMVRHCDAVRLGGAAEPATEARVGVLIESPDGTGGMAGVPCCNYYLLSWATDSPLFASWLRRGTGLDAATIPEVDGLRFEFHPVAGVDPEFFFDAPAPTPSPFTISAALVEPPPGQRLTFLSNFWADTPTGRVRLSITTDNERAGWAHGRLRVAEGSPLAQILGPGPHPFAGPLSSFDLDTATLTKETHSPAASVKQGDR